MENQDAAKNESTSHETRKSTYSIKKGKSPVLALDDWNQPETEFEKVENNSVESGDSALRKSDDDVVVMRAPEVHTSPQELSSGSKPLATSTPQQSELNKEVEVRESLRSIYKEYKDTYQDLVRRLETHRSLKLNNSGRASAPLRRNDFPINLTSSFRESTRNSESRQSGRRKATGRLCVTSRHSARPSSVINYGRNPEVDAQNIAVQRRSRLSRLDNESDASRYEVDTTRRHGPSSGRHSALAAPYRQSPVPRIPNLSNMPQIPIDEVDNYDGQSDNSLDAELCQYTSRKSQQPESAELIFFYGVLQLPREFVRWVLTTRPPPPEFHQLGSMQQAAFLYYFYVFKEHYSSVAAFHNHFNREYYGYVCNNDDDVTALQKICASMRAQLANKMRRMSKANSTVDNFELLSIDSRQETISSSEGPDPEPLSFIRFGPAGRVLHISQEDGCIYIDNMQSWNSEDIKTQLEWVRIQNEKLSQGEHHVIKHYVQTQLEKVSVEEAKLPWKLIEALFTGKKLTGPDVSSIILPTFVTSHSSGSSVTSCSAPPVIRAPRSQVTESLMGGHFEDAVRVALANGYENDAVLLTTFLKKDTKLDEEVETAILNNVRINDFPAPLSTLIYCSKEQRPPILDHSRVLISSWRNHVAIVVSHFSQSLFSIDVILQIGEILRDNGFYFEYVTCLFIAAIFGRQDVFATDDEKVLKFVPADFFFSGIEDKSAERLLKGRTTQDFLFTQLVDYAFSRYQQVALFGYSDTYQMLKMDLGFRLLSFDGFQSLALRHLSEAMTSNWGVNKLSIEEKREVFQAVDLAVDVLTNTSTGFVEVCHGQFRDWLGQSIGSTRSSRESSEESNSDYQNRTSPEGLTMHPIEENDMDV